jgi:hypothetical protein
MLGEVASVVASNSHCLQEDIAEVSGVRKTVVGFPRANIWKMIMAFQEIKIIELTEKVK